MLCCPCVTLLRLYLAIKRLVYAKTSPYLYYISSLKYVVNPFERISRLSQINYLYSYSDSLSRQLMVLWLKPVRIPGPRLAISAIKLETFFFNLKVRARELGELRPTMDASRHSYKKCKHRIPGQRTCLSLRHQPKISAVCYSFISLSPPHRASLQ